MDDQLMMLLQELQTVQQQKTNPMSERTVAQILVKLHRRQFAFYPTTDGNEYVIPQHLDKEIIQLVRQRGKILIGMIPQILNINVDVIQDHSNSITNKSGNTIIKHNNYLLSRQEINDVVTTMKRRLQAQGCIDLEEIALANGFNMAFMKKIVQENMDRLNADLVNNQLITNQYAQLQKARLLGYLNAINRPLQIDSLTKTNLFQERNLQKSINELIKDNMLSGNCQNGYFIPSKFATNQKKIINKFFVNNGFIDHEILRKNFITGKLEKWLQDNLQTKHINFHHICFTPHKLQEYKNQLISMLKGQGFIQLSTVLPFDFSDDHILNEFLTKLCELKDYHVVEGYCYSGEWLQKCCLQFKDKIIYNIFFRKEEGKKKKKSKQSQKQITQEELIETLFDAGLAEYSVLTNMVDNLLPVLNQKLVEYKNKLDRQLAKNKGVIKGQFLKYKKCKTISKTQQSLVRQLNTIEKDKLKKKKKWTDNDFGPSQTDKNGQYALIHYDCILPKNWPTLQQLNWKQLNLQQMEFWSFQNLEKSQLMGQSNLSQLIQIIHWHNQHEKTIKFPFCFLPQRNEKKQSPFVFQFFVSQQDKRYVLVDQLMPYIDEKLVTSKGVFGLIQKAFAKFRYCFKAIFVGIQQLILQITGKNCERIIVNKQQEKNILEIIYNKLKDGNLVIGLGQGQQGKIIKLQDQDTGIFCQKPYSIKLKQEGKFQLYPSNKIVSEQQLLFFFKNLLII